MTFQTAIPTQQPHGELVRRFEIPSAPVTGNGEGLTTLKPSHERVAMLLALGMGHKQIAIATGYAPTTINNLAQDSAIQNAVQDWRACGKADFDTRAGLFNSVMIDATEALRKLIEENGASARDLIEAIKLFAPKVGMQDAPQQVEHSVSDKTITELRSIAQQADNSRVRKAEARIVDAEDADFALVNPPPPGDQQ